MPELIVLSELKQNLYKEGCPIVIRSGALLLDEVARSVSAAMTFRNITNHTITSVLVDIHIFDRANIEVEVVRDYLYLVSDAKRDQEFGSDTHIDIASTGAKSFSVAIRRVAFHDDTIWDGSASLLYETIPERCTIVAELEDRDTVAQFVRDFAANIAKDKIVTAKYVPAEYKDLWLCACGEINRDDEEECYRCGAAYMPQRIHIDNRVEIAANLTAHKRALIERAAQIRLENQRKAEAAAAAKAEAERLAAEELARQEARALRKKRARKVFIAVSIPTAIAIVLVAILYFTYLLPQANYNSAKSLMTDGRYDEAITAFSAMGSYADSPAQVLEAKYQKAEALLEAKDYSGAIDQYTAIEKERDVAARISEAKYQRAKELLTDKKYEEALTLFTEIKTYQDSAANIETCHFHLAQAEIKTGNLPTDLLKTHFAAVSEKDGLTLQQIFRDKGRDLYAAGKTEEGVAWFALVSDAKLLATVDQIYYDEALALIKGKKYDDAAKILKQLGDFEDSKTQLLRINYLKAEAQLKAKKYPEAIALYKKAGSYKDSKEKINACNYKIAAAAFADGDYTKAEELFLALGDYSDAAAQAVEARYELGVQQLANGQAVDSYNTLYPIRSYDKVFSLLVSESQYYIDVYDVGLGPNPLDER